MIFSAMLTGTIALSSCGGGTKEEPKKEINGTDTSAQSAYVCPMGAECGKGDTPGKCASCGMDLVKNEKH